jgi:hypothetical protein
VYGLVSLSRGGPTPDELPSVRRLLTNPYYKGDVIYRGVVYKGAHDP